MAYTQWPKNNEEGGAIKFNLGENPLFNIPLEKVTGCVAGKNEVALNFGNRRDDPYEIPIQLAEIRLMVQDEEKLDDKAAVEDFCRAVKDEMGDRDESQGPICSMPGVFFSTPRGRYDVKFSKSSLSMHGRSFSYQIPFSDIKSIFQLPGDHQLVYFMLHVEPAVGQVGSRTRHNYLVMEFAGDEHETELDIHLSAKQLQSEYGGELEQRMSGLPYDLMAKLLQALGKKRVTVPSTFVGASKKPFATCAHRQAPGRIYPLEKGIVLVGKPSFYISYSDVASVNYERSLMVTRFFDLEVAMMKGSSVTFTSIIKDEMSALSNFLRDKGVRGLGGGDLPATAEGSETPKRRKKDKTGGGSEEDESSGEDYNEDNYESPGEDHESPDEKEGDEDDDDDIEML